MEYPFVLKCLLCGKVYPAGAVAYVCPDHGDEGVLDVQYDYGVIRRRISRGSLKADPRRDIWRYKAFLPVDPAAKVPPLAVGWTPLYDAARLADALGVKKIWVKDDGRQPTASFKDRASALAVVKAAEQGAAVITTASTGNAAAALSGLCASVGRPNVIFVPRNAPEAKIAQLLVFGSRVVLVQGTYDDAFGLCMRAAGRFGWYNRNTGYNPYMTEGKKTAALEICEQLNWHVPDRVFVSVGDGSIIGGLHKGFKDLLALGWIDGMPRLMGVQAAGSNYLYQAWKNNEDVRTKPAIAANTVADSISAGLPRDRIKAMAAVRETRGAFVQVGDEQILAAIPEMARGAGVFGEPAGTAAYAGLVQAVARGLVAREEEVVVLNTGSGLKDVAAALRSVKGKRTAPVRVTPDAEAFIALASGWTDLSPTLQKAEGSDSGVAKGPQ